MQFFKKAYRRLRFQTKVMILTSLLILIIFIALTAYIHSIIASNIEDEVGEKALAVSKTIAQSPDIIAAFDEDKPQKTIQPLTKQIQEDIGAEYIVVGNKEGIRYSHTLEDRIGKRMVGGDNKRALQYGKSYVSKKTGSLGLAIRGKTPVIKDGKIIGVVSVGYLIEDVQKMVQERNQPIVLLLIIFLLIGMIGSVLIAKHLKHLLFDMEPYEISEALLQKNAILESAKEGIIAVDTHNRITLLNQSAKDILQLGDIPDKEIISQPLERAVDIALLDYALHPKNREDHEFILNQEIVLLNTHLLEENGELRGAVATFRKKTDFEKITNELSTIKQYTEGLRSQAHEFLNKIHTILGLLQLGHTEEAIDFIRKDYEIETTRTHLLMETIQEPAIQGLLIAKYNQANEKGIQFEISEESQLGKLSSVRHRDVLLKVLGIMIDNALEATVIKPEPKVAVFITDIGKDILVVIDDNGSGIRPEDEQKIFEDGFSTKAKKNHGKGLFMVKKAVKLLQGEVFLEDSEWDGACFTVVIPKEEVKGESNEGFDY